MCIIYLLFNKNLSLAGKSTWLKQCKMVYSQGISEEEKSSIKDNIRKNTLDSMHNILNKGMYLALHSENEKLVTDFREKGAELTPEIAGLVKSLWMDVKIQETWSRRDEYWHLDSTPYYMENCERFAESEYIPT